jgi:hypothetical protein
MEVLLHLHDCQLLKLIFFQPTLINKELAFNNYLFTYSTYIGNSSHTMGQYSIEWIEFMYHDINDFSFLSW